MSWGSLIVSVLQILTTFITWLNGKKLMKAGEDAAIARASLEVLNSTEEGKRLYEYVQSLSDPEADSLWKRMLRDDPPTT